MNSQFKIIASGSAPPPRIKSPILGLSLILSLIVLMLIIFMSFKWGSSKEPLPTAVNISAWSYGYTIHLKKNEKLKAGKIRFSIKNTSNMGHDAIISVVKNNADYAISKNENILYSAPMIFSDEIEELDVELSKGKYVIWCSVGRHLMEGMYLYFEVI